MSEKPNPCNLKLVMLFEPRDESYCICSHNLSPEDARHELDELRDEGLFVRYPRSRLASSSGRPG
jgi:hypothetical protein